MKKIKENARICSMLFAILMLIFRVSAIGYIDIDIRESDTGINHIGFYVQKGKKREYFWSCSLKGKEGILPKRIDKFLRKIDNLSIPSKSWMYKSLKKACLEYDKLRDADPVIDFDNGIIYMFDYSPDNKYFKKIISILQILSGYRVDSILWHQVIIR